MPISLVQQQRQLIFTSASFNDATLFTKQMIFTRNVEHDLIND